VIVTRNPRGAISPKVPLHDDGTHYNFELIYGGLEYRAYADSVTELCEELIPGYAHAATDVDQAALRIAFAVSEQVRLQAVIVAEAGLDGCSDEQRRILLGSREHPPAIEEWSAPVPLVLVDSFYEPIGELVRPTESSEGQRQDIIWLSPSDETSLLNSLHDAGVIVVSTLL
jgi:hypothetical protein